jgi:hypothetical protein
MNHGRESPESYTLQCVNVFMMRVWPGTCSRCFGAFGLFAARVTLWRLDSRHSFSPTQAAQHRPVCEVRSDGNQRVSCLISRRRSHHFFIFLDAIPPLYARSGWLMATPHVLKGPSRVETLNMRMPLFASSNLLVQWYGTMASNCGTRSSNLGLLLQQRT